MCGWSKSKIHGLLFKMMPAWSRHLQLEYPTSPALIIPEDQDYSLQQPDVAQEQEDHFLPATDINEDFDLEKHLPDELNFLPIGQPWSWDEELPDPPPQHSPDAFITTPKPQPPPYQQMSSLTPCMATQSFFEAAWPIQENMNTLHAQTAFPPNNRQLISQRQQCQPNQIHQQQWMQTIRNDYHLNIMNVMPAQEESTQQMRSSLRQTPPPSSDPDVEIIYEDLPRTDRVQQNQGVLPSSPVNHAFPTQLQSTGLPHHQEPQLLHQHQGHQNHPRFPEANFGHPVPPLGSQPRQVSQAQALLHKLLQILRSSTGSTGEEQQEVLQILKGNPQLMATFIRHKQQQQHQQQSLQSQSQVAANVNNMNQSNGPILLEE